MIEQNRTYHYTTLPNGEIASIACRYNKSQEGYQITLVQGFKNQIPKPKHFPKLFTKDKNEVFKIITNLPGYFPSKSRILAKKPRNEKNKDVKKPRYGRIKQSIYESILSEITPDLKKENEVLTCTFPSKDHQVTGVACHEAMLRRDLNAKTYGIECDKNVFNLLKKHSWVLKMPFCGYDYDFFSRKKCPKFNYIWLDYFGTFEKNKKGFESVFKNKRIKTNGYIAVTFSLYGTKIAGNYDLKVDRIKNRLNVIAKKYNYNLQECFRRKYRNKDINEDASTMVTFLFKVR